MGWPVSVLATSQATPPGGDSVYAADHLRLDLPEHAVGSEDLDRVVGGTVFPGGRVLAALSARLQPERGSVGWADRAGGTRRGNGRGDAAVSGSCLGEIPR